VQIAGAPPGQILLQFITLMRESGARATLVERMFDLILGKF
jgi:hypothetical protein